MVVSVGLVDEKGEERVRDAQLLQRRIRKSSQGENVITNRICEGIRLNGGLFGISISLFLKFTLREYL